MVTLMPFLFRALFRRELNTFRLPVVDILRAFSRISSAIRWGFFLREFVLQFLDLFDQGLALSHKELKVHEHAPNLFEQCVALIFHLAPPPLILADQTEGRK
jgi:hypothetical protein